MGKGGVGKTTLAAATAIALARTGDRVLLVSLDRAHSLTVVLAVDVAVRPGGVFSVADGFDALELDTLALLEDRLVTLSALIPAGAEHEHGSPLSLPDPQELTGLPGAEDLIGLAEVARLAHGGDWDAVLVDCPPTGDLLRLLTVPDMVYDYLERIWPRYRRATVPGAQRWQAMAALLVDRLSDSTLPVRAMLADGENTCARMVLTADAVVVAEARRTAAAMSVLGLRIDGVIVNKVLPHHDSVPTNGSDHPVLRWYADRADRERTQLDSLAVTLGGLPVLTADENGHEPVGFDSLAALADALYPAGVDPLTAVDGDSPAQRVELESGSGVESVYALRLRMPLVDPSTLTLGRVEDDLVVGAAGVRRRVKLASVLRRCTTDGAQFEGGDLVIRFRPDPQVWPQ
ncbi:ArsA family ATPase [Rhodococcus sp. NPDC058514]|uniref:ArsA family ATPase n=1 Tax=Rhodococcus sp. NPDC058514 TaxID=3346532 RepID=UPI0036542D17